MAYSTKTESTMPEPCKATRRGVLDLDLTFGRRGRVRAILEHLDLCETCRRAVQDYDRITDALRGGPGE